jgi:hypothetical protein
VGSDDAGEVKLAGDGAADFEPALRKQLENVIGQNLKEKRKQTEIVNVDAAMRCKLVDVGRDSFLVWEMSEENSECNYLCRRDEDMFEKDVIQYAIDEVLRGGQIREEFQQTRQVDRRVK